jgi:hypothetical protein
MQCYIIWVTTQYDGYEWSILALTRARSEVSAEKKAQRSDFTHDNGSEIQSIDRVEYISQVKFDVLSKYLIII